ncbi:MAG: hypothetical protein E7813_03405 [Bradyrhizobium sp.]|uniref:hypothetical protein n=1 Tax=Bradyrhizobium sp. TaxID=376 RepID=UPI0012041C8B|nr:hypothetical protein [Bradyrhizobium sp.]THD73076.1 MAG: hypothetical protein E7813_03405 [Bradyrhizobium sp.]
MMPAVGYAWSIVRHPAFWLPAMLAIGVDAYVYGMHFNGNAIGSDGWGYYLHLPAIFIYGDPHLAFLNLPNLPGDIAHYRFPDGHWQGLSVHGPGYLDKYTCGPAVLQLPFFLVALSVSYFRYASINGFETTFQVANAISVMFYFSLGSFVIFRACRLRYSALPSALALATVILATNLLDYATGDGSFSHVYGYCILSGVVYLTIWQVESGKAPSLPAFITFGFLMGLAVMVRPTNAVYALLFLVFARAAPLRPLLVGSTCAVLASAVAASPQMILWYVTTGRPIYYSYVGEGFHFRSPELRNYLFSIRKGVFFWHPLYLFMVGALLQQLPRRPFEGRISLLMVLLALYVGASWGDYTFGDSFGSRQSIELLPVLLVPFAGGIAWLLSSRWKWSGAITASALVVLNAVLLNGYINHTLPRNNANLARYEEFWATTLRLPAGNEKRQSPDR